MSAGASLIPSPSMATERPCAFSVLIRASFSSGSKSASTWPNSRDWATASAAARVSPVRRTVRNRIRPMASIARLNAIALGV